MKPNPQALQSGLLPGILIEWIQSNIRNDTWIGGSQMIDRKKWLVVAVLAISACPLRGGEPVSAKPLSFVRDVVPVLTKAGCNSGACHGSFQGRGGFRLSLLGFDPHADYDALVREARGRRVFPADPESSLFLLKPTGRMAHGGGRKLHRESEGYRILREWIAQGMPAPTADDPKISALTPSILAAVLKAGQIVELTVRASWSDRRHQDASAWALYDSTDDRVAEVDGSGRIKATGPGRAVIMVRYQGQVAAVTVTVPFGPSAEQPFDKGQNFIDDLVQAEWKKLGLKPAPLADDAEFVRRVYLDLIGTLPSVKETRAFLASKDPARRARLIDQLLERTEYADYWALKWGDLLRGHSRALGEKGINSFNVWLKQSLRENRPADRIVRELLLAQGNLYTSGPVAFYFVDQTPEDLAETTAQLFLGIRMQCAKCHHHPFEAWSQEDYYGLAAFFTRVERKDTKEGGRFGGAQSVRLKATGQVLHPNTGKVVPPRLLGSPVPGNVEHADPRQPLADWITAKENPYFARNLVNRYWGYMVGRGLVESIDDQRATNPASHPELLDALTRDFTAKGFDFKHLLRTICNSRAYQLASEIKPTRDADGMFITHRQPRRLSAEVLLDAVNQATETSEAFKSLPPGTRAISLPDPTVISSFLDIFGRPKRTTTCECERGARPDLNQVLHLANSLKLHDKVSDERGRVNRLVTGVKNDAEIVEELYLATLTRLPTAAERATVQRLLAQAPSRREGFEDLMWTLLNLGEFAFNH